MQHLVLLWCMESRKTSETVADWSIIGKVAIVTGANTGIGKITALELVKRGASKVILACRNLAAAEEAATDIRQKAGLDETEGPNRVAVCHLDLASISSIRKFASEILENEPQLHLLINNAGINPPADRRVTDDGFELTIQTNYLGQFLLTQLLLDLLKRSSPSRIIALSSDGYLFCWPRGLRIDDLQFEKRTFDFWEAYCQSKLAYLLYCRKLSQQLQAEGAAVSVFSVHPGMVLTDIIRDRSKSWKYFLEKIVYPLKFILISPEKGALTTLHCACTPGIEKHSGGYFKNSHHSGLLAIAEDDVKAAKLWEVSEQLLSSLPPKT